MGTIEIPVPVLGERSDIPANELPIQALRLCSNMIRSPRTGDLEVRPGFTELTTTGPGGRIMGLAYFRTATDVQKIVAANKTQWWEFDGSVWNNITGAALAGSNTQLVRFEVFPVSGTYKVIGVNEQATAKIWDGAAATYSDLGGALTPIDISAAANRVLLLLNPDNVRISEFNDPETYPTTGGFNVRLPDAGDLKIGMERMNRTTVGILGERTQTVARAQPGSSPFRFEKISEQVGPLSKASVVSVGGVLYYLGDDGVVYKFDGTPATEIGPQMRVFVEENLDFGSKKMSHGFFVQPLRKIFFLFPTGGDAPDRGIFFDPKTLEMGRLKFGGITASAQWRFVAGVIWNDLSSFTWNDIDATYPDWNSFGGAFMRQLLGDSAGQVYGYGSGLVDDNGQAIETMWEIPLKSYGGWKNNFVPETCETFFKKSANSTVVQPSLGHTDTLMDEPTLVSLSSFDLSTDQRNDVDLSSVTEKRFVTIRQQANVSKGQFSWKGCLLHGETTEVERGPT